MDINKAKSIILATLFVVTLLSCLLPLKLMDTIRHVADPVRKLRLYHSKFQIICYFILNSKNYAISLLLSCEHKGIHG